LYSYAYVKDQGLFGTQEFHRNHARILQESVQFYRKNVGKEKKFSCSKQALKHGDTSGKFLGNRVYG
jgi:hypothetical protein